MPAVSHRPDLRAFVVLGVVEIAVAVTAVAVAHRCASGLLAAGLVLVTVAYVALAIRTAFGIAGLRKIEPRRVAPVVLWGHPYRSAFQRWN